MKTLLCWIIATLLTAVALAGCGSIRQETAMEWLARQPAFVDDP
jgi:hypothetical protein